MEGNMEELAQKLEKEARPGAFSWYDMMVLIPEVRKLNAEDVYVEVGVDKGRSLDIARKVAKKGVKIYGVDLQEDPGVKGTEFIQFDSMVVGIRWEAYSKKKVSLIHIDGDHSYEGCSRDINAWYPQMKKNGVMLFHDCDETSVGVMRAVTEFVDTHTVKEFRLFKQQWNTSIGRIYL